MDLKQVEFGPKMQACSEMERLFVIEYLQNGATDATDAARKAGYSDVGKHSATIRVRAHVLLHRPRVLEAIEEVGRKYFRGLLFPAIKAIEAIIANPKHPDHAKVATSLLSRLGFAERSAVDVSVSGEVTHNHTDSALDDLRLMLRLKVPRETLVETFGFSGLSRYEKMLAEADARAPKVIEHRAEEAKPPTVE